MMERKIYLLDSNIVSEPSKLNPNSKVTLKMKEMESCCAISAMTWFESLNGAAILPEGKRKQDLERFIYNFIQPRYPIIPYDEHAASINSRIVAELRKTGTPRPIIDTQIASIAIANNMILVTHNTADFEGIPLLMMEDWFEN